MEEIVSSSSHSIPLRRGLSPEPASSWSLSLSSSDGSQLCEVSWKFTGLTGVFLSPFHVSLRMRRCLNIPYRARLKAIAAQSVPAQESVCAAYSVKEKDVSDTDVASLPDTTPLKRASLRSGRASPPFIASHDLTRGAIFAFQALLTYLLMLAVMCVPLRHPIASSPSTDPDMDI